jgi:hypothetical protein
VFFISYEQSVIGFADLILIAADFVLVAGRPDAFFFATPAGDGPLPSLPGVPSFADIYVLNDFGDRGINDYNIGTGGAYVLSNNGTLVSGSGGTWTLRGAAEVPAPGTAALLGICLAGLAFSRRRG